MNREKLIKVLTGVKAGLADKDIVEHSTSFIFSEGQVLTYNDTVSVRHPLDLAIEGAVLATPVLAFLSRVTAEEVTIEQVEAELILKCGKAKAGIPMTAETPDHFTRLKVPSKGWQKLPEGFLEAIRFCLFSTSKDMSKPALTNLHIGDGYIESSDNYRITRAKYEGMFEDGGTPFLLPAVSAKHLPVFAPVEIVIKKSWVHFRNEDKAVLSCRLFSGDFPDISTPLKVKGEKVKFPKNLAPSLERAGVFSSADFDTDREVSIKVVKGKMKVRAEGQDGWFEEKVNAKDMNDMSFTVHPGFLGEILKHSTKAVLAKNAILFKGKNFSHYVSL